MLRLLSLVVIIVVTACDSNQSVEEEVPLGTFEVNIDGVPWKPAFANALMTNISADAGFGDSLRTLTIGGSTLGLQQESRTVTISVTDPQETSYTNDLSAGVAFFDFAQDTALIYTSVSLQLTLSEFSEEVVKGTFEASLEDFEGTSSVELMDGIFALPVMEFSLDDSLFFRDPFFSVRTQRLVRGASHQ